MRLRSGYGSMHGNNFVKQWKEKLGMENADVSAEFERREIRDLEKEITKEQQQKEDEAKAKAAANFEEATYDREQVVEIAKSDLNMLAGIAMPTVFEFMFPPVLLAAWALLCSKVILVRDFSKIALGIPRGHGKTTLIKLFVLYCILFTKKCFILIVSDIEKKAENIVADVVDMLNEPNIRSLFGDWKLGIEKETQSLYKFGYRGRNIILASIGANGSMRGMNLKNARPDVMIFDDIQSKECSESEVQSSALERWLIGTAMKAKSPKGCLYVYAGNMFPGPNCILKKFKLNPSWIKFISGAILSDGTALWEELQPLLTLIDEFNNDIAMGHPEIFLSEVQNDTEIGINKKVDFSNLKPWKWGENDTPQGKFIFIDPAAGKLNSDNTAIGYYEIYDEVLGLREVYSDNLSPGNVIRKAILLALQKNCRCICCESGGYQSTLLYWFEQIAFQLHIQGFQFLEVPSTYGSKNSRISDGLKNVSSGRIVLHPSIRSIVTNQIANWNPMKRDNIDDILDLIGHAEKAIALHGNLMLSDEKILIDGLEGVSVDETLCSF